MSNSIFTSNRVLVLALVLLLTACTGTGAPVQAAPAQAARFEPVTAAPTVVPALEPTATPTLAVKPLLEWEGYTDSGDGDLSKCKSLQVLGDHTVTVGYCKQSPLNTFPLRNPMVLDMLARLAPFGYKTDQDHLTWRGQGQETDSMWQQAVLDWVHTMYGELVTGRMCASCSTVFSWSQGVASGEPGMCRLVYVLKWGYANVGTVPCAGGSSRDLRGGLLTTGEWKALRDLTGNFAINPDLPTNGQGSQVPGNDDLTNKLNAWSRGIYDRLAQP